MKSKLPLPDTQLFIAEQHGVPPDRHRECVLSNEWRSVPYFGPLIAIPFDFFNSERAEERWLTKTIYWFGC